MRVRVGVHAWEAREQRVGGRGNNLKTEEGGQGRRRTTTSGDENWGGKRRRGRWEQQHHSDSGQSGSGSGAERGDRRHCGRNWSETRFQSLDCGR